MKLKALLLIAIAAVAAWVINAATFDVPTQKLRTTAPVSQDLLVTNANNTVGVTVQKSSASVSKLISASHAGTAMFTVETNGTINSAALTASLPVFSDSSKNLSSKTIANTLLALGIQKGTVSMAALDQQTNTFSTAFSSAPVIVFTGPTNALPHLVTVSATGFTVGTDGTNHTIQWIAIGAP